MNSAALTASLPLLILAVAAVLAMIGIAIKRSHAATAVVSLTGLILSFVSLWPASSATPTPVTSLFSIDNYALLYMGIILAASAAVVLLSFPYLEQRPEHKEEFYLLILLATVGSMALTGASHMASFFLSLELLSISLYALIAYARTESRPLEAGIKYLVLAASSSAFLLFGLALIYIAQGTMEFSRMSSISTNATGGFAYLAGIVLVITGIGFKLAVVPFHLWTPDVYQGAPLPVTAFVASVSKGGVFAFLLRWLRTGNSTTDAIPLVIAIVAIASMLVGNLLALRQTNIKRLLAYSSIAHMGYFLVAIVAGGDLGRAAATYYLTAYLITILGAFGSLLALSHNTREAETFDDVRGLFWRRPVLASVFTAMLLSLAGIPLTAGFLGKFYVLAAGASATSWTLIIVLIVSSTIGLVYYLRVIVAMFSDAKASSPVLESTRVGIAPALALAALTAALFVLGVDPTPLWDAIRAAALS
jgi:NADH-quinone oxidoreductase subunit N